MKCTRIGSLGKLRWIAVAGSPPLAAELNNVRPVLPGARGRVVDRRGSPDLGRIRHLALPDPRILVREEQREVAERRMSRRMHVDLYPEGPLGEACTGGRVGERRPCGRDHDRAVHAREIGVDERVDAAVLQVQPGTAVPPKSLINAVAYRSPSAYKR